MLPLVDPVGLLIIVFVLDHKVLTDAVMLASGAYNSSSETAITILAKQSDHVETFFENSKGMVEGVDDVFYSNRMIVREIRRLC